MGPAKIHFLTIVTELFCFYLIVNRIVATWKSKIRNVLNQQPKNDVILVQPIDSADSNDDKTNIETEHLKTFRTIWKLVDSMAYVVGVSAFQEVDINARMVIVVMLITVAFLSLFYTIFVVWPNIPLLLEVLCIFGVLLPATLKFILILKNVKYLLPLNTFFENILIYHPNGHRRTDVLAKEMDIAYCTLKIFVAVSFLCLALFALYPMYAYVNESRLIPIMRMEFPFVDQTSTKGFFIGASIMLVFGIMGVLGSVAFDLAVVTLLLQYKSLVTLLLSDLVDYDEIIQNRDLHSPQYLDSFFLNICKKFGDINRYMRCFEKTFSDNTLYSVLALYASLICSVYAVLNNGWISGYGFCLFCFIQLYVQCILGTFVDIQNKKKSQAFYFTSWYEYPVKVQKLLMLLLHASSFNAIQLRIGPYAPLNVETGLMITKGVFSYYTTMSNLT